jgi:prepilin-type N-terminal cleavage/methylation domain-containing protein
MFDPTFRQVFLPAHPRRGCRGFTLIEVLVVVAIIALLISVLLPALKSAREQARWAKCLGHMSSLPKAVLTFAQSHAGRGQLLLQSGDNDEALVARDQGGTFYAYQADLAGIPNPVAPFRWLKHWTVAYGKELGVGRMTRTENYTEATAADGGYVTEAQHYYTKYTKLDVFVCPSDTNLVRMMVTHAPPGQAGRHGVISYGVNADVFGVSPYRSKAGWSNPRVWNAGELTDRLQGRLDRIIRPSEVALFADGGNEWRPGENADFFTDSSGPYIEHSEYIFTRLPHNRHGRGGLSVALADGSSMRLRPLHWVNNCRIYSQFDRTFIGIDFVKDFNARIRVTPLRTGTPPLIKSGT